MSETISGWAADSEVMEYMAGSFVVFIPG